MQRSTPARRFLDSANPFPDVVVLTQFQLPCQPATRPATAIDPLHNLHIVCLGRDSVENGLTSKMCIHENLPHMHKRLSSRFILLPSSFHAPCSPSPLGKDN